MQKINMDKPIKDASRSKKKMKYDELIAYQQAQSDSAKAASLKNPLDGSKPFNPDKRGYSDTVNTTLYGTTTLVNDHSKVYKGGSWNDLAFWLNPATRRFMNEDDASAEVGFRCAMTLVGAPEINPNGKPHYSVKNAKPFKAH
ncbi:MAG TPA: hypothetical protein DCO83_17150 [Mucilaginibacter sp.]|nr:hypothetical protein [Mucilaginibacter sp.]